MKIRTYESEKDYNYISSWIKDERIHNLWCAARFEFPLNKDNFNSVLDAHFIDYGDKAYTVTDDNGSIIGFFVCNLNKTDNSAFLKFVILNHTMRGKGLGTKMLQNIADYFSSEKNAAQLRLVVFDVNLSARKCYEKAGFIIESEEHNAFEFKDENWGRIIMIKTL